jgi:hypothetical protein
MARPTDKHSQIERFLDGLSDRTNSIEGDVCIPPPLGCGEDASEFTDELSEKEYTISGLCQSCQNIVFGLVMLCVLFIASCGGIK